jgi:SAM-dependent methyltransferase
MNIATPGLFKRTRCRLCDSARLEMVLPMHPTPIADAFLPASQMDEARQLYPLDLYFCLDCAHLQLLDVIDPDLLFSNYIYVTDTSPGLVEHFDRYCEEVCRRFPFPAGKWMMEIGSNAGVLLRFFQKRGFKVLGIDPAREIARQATAEGVETLPAFFNEELARRIRSERGAASVIAANNVFAHSDDLAGMARGIDHLLADDGVFIFEVSYLIDVMEKMLFDTVYHEHLSFHSVKPLRQFLRKHGLELIDVQRIATKGGSIRCLAQRVGGPYAIEPSVDATIGYETAHGYDQAETFRQYGPKIHAVRDKVLGLLEGFRSRGELIMGYGAAPAVTTLIYQFELAPYLSAIVDDNPRKHGRFSPGHKIPILPSSALAERRPACVLILAWTYADRIVAHNGQIGQWGGQFLIPLPVPKLIKPD